MVQEARKKRIKTRNTVFGMIDRMATHLRLDDIFISLDTQLIKGFKSTSAASFILLIQKDFLWDHLISLFLLTRFS